MSVHLLNSQVPDKEPDLNPATLGEWFYLGVCLYGGAARGWGQDKCDKFARHWWPLAYYKIKGIPEGRQWDILGYLAARYARDLPVTLADELWEVMEASPQDSRNPWRRHHAVDIAARAQRFVEREDAAEREWLTRSGAFAWALSTMRRPTVAGLAAAWRAAQ